MPDPVRPFAIYLYPFRHHLPDSGERPIPAGWRPWPARLDTEAKKGRALDSSFYFLAFVREMLFPEFCQGAAAHTLHLTAAEKPAGGRLRFEGPGGPYACAFACDWIDVCLFPEGVGFLAIKATPAFAAGAGHRELVTFNYHFRMVLPPRPGWTMAKLELDGGPGVELREWVDRLLAGLHDAGPSYTASRQAYERGERFATFSYYGGAAALPPAFEGSGLDPAEVAAYELVAATPVEPPNVPARGSFEGLLERCRVSVWSDWTAVALRDGVAFVSRAGGGGALAANVEHDYFFLYLYCLHQKTALLDVQDRLLLTEPGTPHTLGALKAIFDRFVAFRNRFWGVEVTRRAVGMELYRAMQEGLETTRLYGAIGGEVDDLHEYYQNRVTHRTNTLVNLMAFVGFPATLMLSFLSINLRGITATGEGIEPWHAVAGVGAALGLGGLAWWGLSRGKEAGGRSRKSRLQ